ncbi:MAG: MMPL family transporter, partial [Oleiphilaceae bacterium]|nr:MMPL family transporter [Oleiphilaceae bacterium]
MQSLHTRFNAFFEQAPGICLRWRWPVLLLFVLLTVWLTYGMVARFTMEMSLESWFKDEDPAKLSLDRFRQVFGSDDGLYIVYAPNDGDVFSEQSIATLTQLHKEFDALRFGLKPKAEPFVLEQLGRVERVDSLYNARYQVAEGDTLIAKRLLQDDFPATDAARDAKRQLAHSQPTFELAYFSKDDRYGGIRFKTDFGVVPLYPETGKQENNLLAEDDWQVGGELQINTALQSQQTEYAEMQMEEYLDFMTALRQVTSQPEYAHFTFYYTGNAAMMEFAMNNMKQAVGLMGLMVVAVVLLLWLLFHSFSAVIWPVLVICCSAFWSIGLLSWLDVELSNMVSLSFMLILAVGVADCVHVLSAYIYYRDKGFEHRDAMRKAYRKTGMPIFLTTITTMAGMLALTISDLPQISTFGVNSALGVATAFIFTVFLLPVLLDIWHPYTRKQRKQNAQASRVSKTLQTLLDRIPAWIGRRAKSVTIAYFALFFLFIFGATQVKVDTNLAELTKENSEIRVTYELVDNHMMGGQNLEFLLDFGQPDALKQPDVLKAIDDLQQRLETQYPEFVVKTFSLADVVKDTHKVMQQGQEAYYSIPDDARLTGQLLYLFDNANADDRRQLVSDDYAQSHIGIQLRNKGSYEYTQFFDAIRQDLRDSFAPFKTQYPQMQVEVTGSLALMMELIDYISWAQLKSFTFALVIITLLLIVALGSVQAGLISMVPNLLPAFFTFGVMGLAGIPLDTDTLIIAPLIIGIAVDDTIHFVAHYRDAWFES